jgi:hypothetical protein
MRRWEAFHLAAQVEAAETPYRPRAIRLRGARDERHEVVVEDTRSGARFSLRSAEEWRERVGLADLGALAQRVRWTDRGEPLRGDLVAEYERLAGGLDVTPGTVRDPSELFREVEALIARACPEIASRA